MQGWAAWGLWTSLVHAGAGPEGRRLYETCELGPFEADLYATGEPGSRSRPVVTDLVIRYGDEVVEVEPGQEGRLIEVVWLADAVRPALLAFSGRTTLVTERDGKPEVLPLPPAEYPVSHFQWLDGPGDLPRREVLIRAEDRRGRNHKLQGGNLLLIDLRRVLDLRTLQVHELPWDGGVGGYALGPAIVISPDHRHIVFLALSGPTTPADALLVVPYDDPSASYAIPLERDARIHVSAAWVWRNFRWDEAGKLVSRGAEHAQ